ncbi:hypothetical protein MMC32_005452 [Xylographa parallela]|nr:hypothetical protein [Xylographa parallela]
MDFLRLSTSNFACGGSLKISTQETGTSTNSPSILRSPTNPPIALRWDSEKGGCKTQFPPNDNSIDPSYSNLADLVRDCSPATFGHEGKDVLDEQYRKAAKLDNTQFSTNFNPHDSGIIAAITQVLLPSFAKPKPTSSSNSPQPDQRQEYISTDQSSLSTELYKLNIYSAPFGKFKAHVDTPRGPNQFGSLVVCLPYTHQGGQLQVRHSGEQISYDWSNDDASTISWAAFYSDCEHEVFEVISGYRVTLTYNLYIYEDLGNVVQSTPSADPTRYPLYKKMSELLNNGDFMPEGFGYRVHLRPVLETLEDASYHCRDPDDSDYEEDGDRVGTELHMIQITDEQKDGDDISLEINDQLSNPAEVALVYLKYGNQAQTAWNYSYLAISIDMPKHSGKSTKDSKVKQNEQSEEVSQQKASSEDKDVEMEESEGAI